MQFNTHSPAPVLPSAHKRSHRRWVLGGGALLCATGATWLAWSYLDGRSDLETFSSGTRVAEASRPSLPVIEPEAATLAIGSFLGTSDMSERAALVMDSDYFYPGSDEPNLETISFIGRMDYYPNIECMQRFCAQVWPLLRQSRPNLKLLIVGADPKPEVQLLAKLPGVTVTGSVPDVRPYVRGSVANIAPLAIARGTQNKILEAMAMGVPVVTTRLAAGGVDAEAEKHLLVADTPADTAAAILRIVDQPAERARLAIAGRERMLSHHAWPRSMQRLDALIASCRSQFGRPASPSLEHTT